MSDQVRPPLILDLAAPDQLIWHGLPVRLTPSQCAFLTLLAHHPGRVLTHDQIYHHMYTAHGEIVEPTMVHWHKSTLQKWVAAITGYPLPIRHLPRRGYVLQLDPDEILILEAT